jgi:hypothetical protein
VDPSVAVLLPLPTSRCSRLDRLTIRSAYSIISFPPSIWSGKTVFLAEMYAEKWNARVNKFEEEQKQQEARWFNNPLDPPEGVSAKEWEKRCLAADERERATREGSDTTITGETMENSKFKVKGGNAKDKKLKVSKGKSKSLEEIKSKAKKRLSM